MADVAALIFPDFKLQWLVDETKRNLPCELNFIMEGQNSEKTANYMKHLPWLHVCAIFVPIINISCRSHTLYYYNFSLIYYRQVPKVYWNFSTQRVLTMEYCNGLDVGELSTSSASNGKFDSHKKEISRRITQMFSDMIFLHGYVHCDPHPGKIRVILFSIISIKKKT